jgi:YgiT-type zinc finger domain-containing protein
MRCGICRLGEIAPGTTTIVLEPASTTVVFKGVPTDVCDACGEAYMTSELTKDLLQRAEAAAARGVEVEVVHYAA